MIADRDTACLLVRSLRNVGADDLRPTVASRARKDPMMDAMELRTISVFCGLDFGKGEHHATALDRDGHRLHDRPLPQDEQALRALFDKLNAHGPVVAVVDQDDYPRNSPGCGATG